MYVRYVQYKATPGKVPKLKANQLKVIQYFLLLAASYVTVLQDSAMKMTKMRAQMGK
jgi:septum formation topological specificity factor MinE